MIDKIFIQRKIQAIREYSEEINKVFKLASLTDIENDFLKLRTLERDVQLVADAMIDINNHFIKRLGLKVPDSFQNTFIILAENKILPEKFAEKISPLVAVRNILVHQYDELDIGLFLRTTEKEREDFTKYIEFVLEYLNKAPVA